MCYVKKKILHIVCLFDAHFLRLRMNVLMLFHSAIEKATTEKQAHRSTNDNYCRCRCISLRQHLRRVKNTKKKHEKNERSNN